MKSFVKRNTTKYDDALFAEYKGLLQLQKLLEKVEELETPYIIDFTQEQLELELVQRTSPTHNQMKQLGIGLAKMHKKSFELYGLAYDNYIGLNPQKNGLYESWGEFFTQKRLFSQICMIMNNRLQKEFSSTLEKNQQKLENFLNETTAHPSLVHGDLWNGNVLFSNEKVFLIDPAIYYADREVDIAMTEIFGGFSKDFYESYNETFPLHKEYETKKIIYNLYHYLNHYNLFGEAYLDDCFRGFKAIEKL